jgi:hypothetical protein
VEGSCERNNEPSGFIKLWEVLEWLYNRQSFDDCSVAIYHRSRRCVIALSRSTLSHPRSFKLVASSLSQYLIGAGDVEKRMTF